jgi:hypothetical protein
MNKIEKMVSAKGMVRPLTDRMSFVVVTPMKEYWCEAQPPG